MIPWGKWEMPEMWEKRWEIAEIWGKVKWMGKQGMVNGNKQNYREKKGITEIIEKEGKS